MGLKKIPAKKRSEIVQRWFDELIQTYPGDSARFLKETKDPFANPVGSATLKSLEDVLNALLDDMDRDTIIPLLDPTVRIRAVQEFSPSSSVSFVFFLKKIFRDSLEEDIKKGRITSSDLSLFDSKVDGLCLIAFDIYMGCREQIFRFRAEHVKSRTLKLLEKADILCEVPEVGTEIIPHNVFKNGGFEDK